MKNYSKEINKELNNIALAFYYNLYSLNVRSGDEFDLLDIPEFIKHISTKENIKHFTDTAYKQYWGIPN